MAIERSTYLYQMLIRFGPDGLQGAQAIEIEAFMENGATVGLPSELPARPIAETEMAPLIGAEGAKLVATAANAVAKVQELRGDVAAAEAAREKALDEARTAFGLQRDRENDLSLARQEIANLKRDLANALAEKPVETPVNTSAAPAAVP